MLKSITDTMEWMWLSIGFLWFLDIVYILYSGNGLYDMLFGVTFDLQKILVPIFLLRLLLVFIDKRLGNDNYYIHQTLDNNLVTE